jgi:hypothetical protein
MDKRMANQAPNIPKQCPLSWNASTLSVIVGKVGVMRIKWMQQNIDQRI